MKPHVTPLKFAWCGIAFSCAITVLAQNNPGAGPTNEQRPPPAFDGRPGFDGPPPFGPDGFGPGGPGPGGPGPGGMMGQKTELVKKYDKDGDGRLNKEERKAAREFLSTQNNNRGPGGFRGPGGGRGGAQTPAKPGVKLTPADAKSFADAPVYDMGAVRTFFLEFEDADWEKQLSDFKNTDVDLPAKLSVDGKIYPDIGVHFQGMSSYFMIPEGRKHSLKLSLDFVHEDQHFGGCRTLVLLNSNDDPTFLRTILFSQVSRDYIAAPRANHARVAINGENWGVYVNSQQYNKEFVKDHFGTTKGARWKTPGSPNGKAGFNYLGDDPAAYKSTYEIKTKDDPKSWADLIKLFKVLNETPADKLEEALAPLLDIDGALKFLALDNVLVNNDGFWARACDYCIYQDAKGRFHVIPRDFNETFSAGRGGPGGPGGFGPGLFLSRQILEQGDKNADQKLSADEFAAQADAWFDKLDKDKAGKMNQEQFTANMSQILPAPQGFGPPGGGQQPGGRRGGFGPAMIGPGLFKTADINNDGSLTRDELRNTFAKWFGEWDKEKTGFMNEETLREGLNAALPRPNFGGPGGGPGGRRGPGGGPGGPGGGGVELDPLVSATDQSKPLASKLLAVPAWRTRYLGYVRDIAEKWLDWNKLGPVARQYHAAIAEDVKMDTRKIETTEAFLNGLGDDGKAVENSLKNFAEKRRAYLLNHAEIKKLAR